jgi:D-glycero-D-manno-heptose 1,7-bisphosphate phosphatase
MIHKAAFLDLNGTLALPVTPERLSDLQPIPGAFDAVARLTRAGFVCPVVTVQSRIAKGLYSLSDFVAWFERFAADAARQGAALSGPYVCPHRYAAPCPCKKPQRLLYDQATIDLRLTLSESVVIGDSPEDMQAAAALGALGCLVQTGWAADRLLPSGASTGTAFVGPSIVEAVEWILSRS